MTPEERLDEMRARIVKARKRDLMQAIAVEVMEGDGDYSIIPDLFEQRWQEPSRDDLDEQVAGKISAGIQWMEQELQVLLSSAVRGEDKVEKFRELLRHAEAGSDNSESTEALLKDLDDFRQLQTYLGVEPTPPSGATRAARAGVAEIAAREED